ncbi:MAG: glycosyltransferase [Bacteroides sp.]|nr:glycosyltransferase [Bacteroides sp.]
MESPLVSVIIPSFNKPASIIEKSINSVIGQTYTNWELLIVDDSTQIETKEAIDKYKDRANIQIFRFPNRLGVSSARNYGMEQAKGKYIAFLDGDDVATPNRLELQVKYFIENPETSVFRGSYVYNRWK